MQYGLKHQPRSDLKLDQNPYFAQKMFFKIGFFFAFVVGMGLRFVKTQHFLYQNVRLDETHRLYLEWSPNLRIYKQLSHFQFSNFLHG